MVTRAQLGGLVSFLSFVASAVFFFLLLIGVAASFSLSAAGLFCLALAFVLARFGV